MFQTSSSTFQPAQDRLAEGSEALAGAGPETPFGYLVRDLNRAYSRALAERIAAHGVSMGQWFFLYALWQEDGLNQRTLSQRVGMMEPTTVTALNGMERANLVRRVRDSKDRRKVNVFLTPKGRSLRDVLMPSILEVEARATAGVSQEELNVALSVLHRAIANLEMNPRSRANRPQP